MRQTVWDAAVSQCGKREIGLGRNNLESCVTSPCVKHKVPLKSCFTFETLLLIGAQIETVPKKTTTKKTTMNVLYVLQLYIVSMI